MSCGGTRASDAIWANPQVSESSIPTGKQGVGNDVGIVLTCSSNQRLTCGRCDIVFWAHELLECAGGGCNGLTGGGEKEVVDVASLQTEAVYVTAADVARPEVAPVDLADVGMIVVRVVDVAALDVASVRMVWSTLTWAKWRRWKLQQWRVPRWTLWWSCCCP